MHRKDAIAWVVSVCSVSLRLSQAKTLAILVAGAMRVQRVSLANIGRQMVGCAKHQIKRCWWFCANERVESADAMRGVLKRVLKNRKKKLLISFDWTDIKGMQMLMAAAVMKGRAVPLCWASCTGHTYDGQRSRNAFEESLLLVLRSMIPPQVKVVILADRGFGRTELARFCQRQGFGYVIRIQPDVHVKSRPYTGKLLDYPVHKGIARVLKNVDYRQKNPVRQHVVIRWKKGLPQKRDECWFLATDQDATAVRLSDLYGQRMSVEQLFRDGKSKRNGWSLRDTRITSPHRLDRLMLILALAYLLLCGIGLLARQLCRPAQWSSNSNRESCSVFQIGLLMLQKLKCSAAAALAAFRQASEEAVPKWG
jgi:DDE family transposase